MREGKAFTLVEMLVVVLILGALAIIAVPRITSASKAAKDRICRTNVDLINRQIELYHTITDSWPGNLKDVTENPDYFPDGEPECPFEWEYEIDEDNHRVIGHGDHSEQGQSGDDDDDDSDGGGGGGGRGGGGGGGGGGGRGGGGGGGRGGGGGGGRGGGH